MRDAHPRLALEQDRRHEVDYPLSHIHLRRSDTDMGIRDSLSKLKKKFKPPPTEGKRKPEKIGADASGERDDFAGSPFRPEPHVVAGGSHGEEDNGANVGGLQALIDQLPQPDGPGSVPAREGGTDDGEASVDRGGASQVHPHPRPRSDAGVVVRSGPSGEGDSAGGEKVERVHPSLSAPPIPHDGEPSSM